MLLLLQRSLARHSCTSRLRMTGSRGASMPVNSAGSISQEKVRALNHSSRHVVTTVKPCVSTHAASKGEIKIPQCCTAHTHQKQSSWPLPRSLTDMLCISCCTQVAECLRSAAGLVPVLAGWHGKASK